MLKRKMIALVLPVVVGIVALSGCEMPAAKPVEKTVYVAPYMTECFGETTQSCMLVKEDPGGEYTFFYDQIEGFDYQEGYEYELRIREEIIDSSTEGGQSVKWVLIEVVNQLPVEQIFSLSGIEGKLWQLKSYLDTSGSLVEVLPDTTITAIFLQGKLEGNAGCNNYFGSYKLDADQLAFSEIGSTDMFCNEPDGVMDQETGYLEALAASAAYKFSQDRLQLFGVNGETIMVYDRVAPKPLIGTIWSLEFFNDGVGSYTSVDPQTSITTIFNADNTVEGNSGCNTFTSTYSQSENSLSIGTIALTRMYCAEPEGVMEQEKAFLAALENSSTYTIDGNTLVTFDNGGERLLRYTSKPKDVLPTPTPVEGSEEFAGPIWKWISFTEEGQDQLIVDNPFSYTIEFLPDGTLRILADCNQAEGSYSIKNGQFSLEITTSTINNCPEGSLSDGFLRLLSDAVMIATGGDYLSLELSNETGRMVFSKGDEIVLPTQPPVTPTPSPAVTPSPQSSPTPIPTPTRTPTPPANIVFEDDFSVDTGWMIYKADTHTFRWEEGSYYISVNTLNGYIWSTRTVELSDGSVETVANQVEGDEDGYYGVVCRFQTGTDYYAFVINENGSYGIALMQYGLLDFINQGVDQNGIIKRDGQLNTIRGECVGDTLTLYVNGEKLSEVKDPSFTGGEVGIIAITFFQKNSVIRYDRFTVYER